VIPEEIPECCVKIGRVREFTDLFKGTQNEPAVRSEVRNQTQRHAEQCISSLGDECFSL
jgi:hypothetical protein